MNKCHWEDGKFVSCESGAIHRTSLAGDSIQQVVEENRSSYNFCPFCGSYICNLETPSREVILNNVLNIFCTFERSESANYKYLNTITGNKLQIVHGWLKESAKEYLEENDE